MNRPTSFALHIRPLFRQIDIDKMAFKFDLADHGEVSANSGLIVGRLKGTTGAVMPPVANDGPWPNEWIDLFERWIAEGRKP